MSDIETKYHSEMPKKAEIIAPAYHVESKVGQILSYDADGNLIGTGAEVKAFVAPKVSGAVHPGTGPASSTGSRNTPEVETPRREGDLGVGTYTVEEIEALDRKLNPRS